MSSVISLLATAMGGGLLSLPHALANCGLAVGASFLVASGLAAGHSLEILVACAEESGQPSYEGNVRFYLGRTWQIVLNISLVLLLILASSSMFVIIMDLAPMLLVSVFGETLFLCRYAVGLYAMALMFYFSTQDTLDALRCTSSVALGCISFLVLAIVFTYVRDPVIFDTVTLASSPATWFEGLPIMFSAYCCQFNIFKIKDELRSDQKKNINLVIRIAIPGIATTVYLTGGLLGYLMFGADVRQDLLTEFPSSKLFAVARGMLALTNMFKLPLLLIPLRMSFLEAVGFNPVGLNARKHIAFCLVLNLISFTTACTLGSLSKALGLSGCTAGVLISFVMPGLMRLRHLESRGVLRRGLLQTDGVQPETGNQTFARVSAWMLVVGGAFAGVASLISMLFNWQKA